MGVDGFHSEWSVHLLIGSIMAKVLYLTVCMLCLNGALGRSIGTIQHGAAVTDQEMGTIQHGAAVTDQEMISEKTDAGLLGGPYLFDKEPIGKIVSHEELMDDMEKEIDDYVNSIQHDGDTEGRLFCTTTCFSDLNDNLSICNRMWRTRGLRHVFTRWTQCKIQATTDFANCC